MCQCRDGIVAEKDFTFTTAAGGERERERGGEGVPVLFSFISIWMIAFPLAGEF